ncbi:MAG: DUF3489 domain-containing protein [Burkholderiaceae bacterium]|nr:DUF3489 domain-containing protein [Burkholderiaceae bacterium]
MKTNATGSKATAAKAAKKIAVPAKSVAPVKATSPVSAPIAKTTRRGRAKVDVPLPIAPTAPAEPVGTSKQARLISLLKAAPGATLEQMMSLTGWQAHTVRGTISGVLRKRLGLNVVCAGESGSRSYRIVAA